jgi:NADH dehydrogenase FAD-containing subunit
MVADRGASFVQDFVTHLDPHKKVLTLKSGNQIYYDVVSCNTGSFVPADEDMVCGDHVFTVKPIENLIKARNLIDTGLGTATPQFLIVGGGAAALELAGNLWRIIHSKRIAASITILGGHNFLSSMPPKAQRYARNSLMTRSIDIIEGAKVSRMTENHAVMEDGREFFFDLLLLAWGIRPSRLFSESGVPTGPDGGLLVNTYLQSVPTRKFSAVGIVFVLRNNRWIKWEFTPYARIQFCITIYWPH